MRTITLRAFNRDAGRLDEPVQITHRDTVLGTFTPAAVTFTTSMSADQSQAWAETYTRTTGSEVQFAPGTPPTEELADIRPRGKEIVVAAPAGPRPKPPAPPPDFNTRPFTPVPKTAKKK